MTTFKKGFIATMAAEVLAMGAQAYIDRPTPISGTGDAGRGRVSVKRQKKAKTHGKNKRKRK